MLCIVLQKQSHYFSNAPHIMGETQTTKKKRHTDYEPSAQSAVLSILSYIKLLYTWVIRKVMRLFLQKMHNI